MFASLGVPSSGMLLTSLLWPPELLCVEYTWQRMAQLCLQLTCSSLTNQVVYSLKLVTHILII